MLDSFVAHEGMDLGDGDNTTVVCPMCGGGSTRSKSMSIGRKAGDLVYICFRAKCGVRGKVHSTPSVNHVPKKKREYPQLDMESVGQHSDAKRICTQFGLDWSAVDNDSLARYEIAPDKGRICWTVFDPDGKVRGYVRRGYDGQEPKAINWFYREDSTPLSWYLGGERPVIAVEDIPSAVRLSRAGRSAVALMGCHPGADAVAELVRTSPDIVWALDPDATEKAIRLQQKWGMFFQSSSVLVLPKDVKDMTNEEFVEWVNGL